MTMFNEWSSNGGQEKEWTINAMIERISLKINEAAAVNVKLSDDIKFICTSKRSLIYWSMSLKQVLNDMQNASGEDEDVILL